MAACLSHQGLTATPTAPATLLGPQQPAVPATRLQQGYHHRHLLHHLLAHGLRLPTQVTPHHRRRHRRRRHHHHHAHRPVPRRQSRWLAVRRRWGWWWARSKMQSPRHVPTCPVATGASTVVVVVVVAPCPSRRRPRSPSARSTSAVSAVVHTIPSASPYPAACTRGAATPTASSASATGGHEHAPCW